MEAKLLASTIVTDEVWDRLDRGMPWADDSDHLAEYAGRICYQSWDKPNPATATNAGYLANILDHEHYSVLEHGSATFLVTDVSRHLLGELTRHRHASPSVESLRFCPPRGYALHPTLAEYDQEHEMAEHWEVCLARYNRVYDRLTAMGVAKKQAREATAQFLPLSTATDLVITGNMRVWRELLMKRLAPGANREIIQLAELVLVELRELAPNIFMNMEESVSN